MNQDTPEHRQAMNARSGDTHVIGAEDNAVAVNVDQKAREESSRPPAAEGASGTNAAADGGVMPPAGDAQAPDSPAATRGRKPAE